MYCASYSAALSLAVRTKALIAEVGREEGEVHRREMPAFGVSHPLHASTVRLSCFDGRSLN